MAALLFYIMYDGCALSVVIIVENEISDSSSNLSRGYLHFPSLSFGKGMEP